MNDDRLTDGLVATVMGWKVAPERFLMGRRRWIPRWRFAPLTNLEDAFRLLDAAQPEEYAIRGSAAGEFQVRVRLASGTGEARDASKPRAVTIAIARALGFDVEGVEANGE